jgi:hypothetical protein
VARREDESHTDPVLMLVETRQYCEEIAAEMRSHGQRVTFVAVTAPLGSGL